MPPVGRSRSVRLLQDFFVTLVATRSDQELLNIMKTFRLFTYFYIQEHIRIRELWMTKDGCYLRRSIHCSLAELHIRRITTLNYSIRLSNTD